MPRQFATITLIGNDQAGVIAHITQLLFQLGANIEALEEQVSRGRFSMTLQASWPTARFERTAGSGRKGTHWGWKPKSISRPPARNGSPSW